MARKLLICLILAGLSLGPVGCSTTKGGAAGKVAGGGIKRGWLRRMVERNAEPVKEGAGKAAGVCGIGALAGLGMYLDSLGDPTAPEGSFAKRAYDSQMNE